MKQTIKLTNLSVNWDLVSALGQDGNRRARRAAMARARKAPMTQVVGDPVEGTGR